MPSSYNNSRADYFPDGVDNFRNMAKKYPLLTRQEEIELNQRRLAGDESAKERLILCNLRLVVSRTVKFTNNPSKRSDLVDEAYFGLCRAVEEFDEQRGTKFSTYAVNWIDKHLHNYYPKFVRVPSHLKNLISRIGRLENEFYQTHEKNPTEQELAGLYENRYGKVISVEKIKEARDIYALYKTQSLDDLCSNPDDRDKAPYQFAQTVFEDPNDIAEKIDLSERLDEVLSKLTKREEMVIRLRYGINSERYGEKGGLLLEDI